MALERVVLLAAGAAMLLLATLVLAVGVGRAVNRAFAALLAARGMAVLLPQASADPQWLWTALALQPYFALAVAPLAAYLVWTAGGAPRSAPQRRRAGWAAVGVVAALDLAYWLDHGLFHTLAAGEPAVGALRAAPGVRYEGFGPLALVAALGAPLLALLGLRLAMRYREEAEGEDAPTLLLVSAGLLVGGLFDGANRLAASAALLDGIGGYPWLPWGWALLALPIVALAPAALGVAVLAAGRTIDPRPLHRLEGLAIALSALAFFSGFLRLAAPADSDLGGRGFVLVLLGLWRLAMPALVSYALLRRGRGEASPDPLAAAAPAPLEA